MAASKKRTRTQLTLDEQKKEDDLKYSGTAALALSPLMFIRNETQAKSTNKKRKTVVEDDSEETLEQLLQWNNNTTSEIPPEYIIGDADVAERCSKPIRKQLTESDVKENQNRLMLGKVQVEKTMLPLLKESEIPRGINGLKVAVFGPDGEIHEMMFKLWNQKTPVLTSGWNKFVANYGFEMHCDFLTIWMFRHRVTREICFAINSTSFDIRKQLSRRISNVVFKDSN